MRVEPYDFLTNTCIQFVDNGREGPKPEKITKESREKWRANPKVQFKVRRYRGG